MSDGCWLDTVIYKQDTYNQILNVTYFKTTCSNNFVHQTIGLAATWGPTFKVYFFLYLDAIIRKWKQELFLLSHTHYFMSLAVGFFLNMRISAWGKLFKLDTEDGRNILYFFIETHGDRWGLQLLEMMHCLCSPQSMFDLKPTYCIAKTKGLRKGTVHLIK